MIPDSENHTRMAGTVKPDQNIEFPDERDYDRRKNDRNGRMKNDQNYIRLNRRHHKRRSTD